MYLKQESFGVSHLQQNHQQQPNTPTYFQRIEDNTMKNEAAEAVQNFSLRNNNNSLVKKEEDSLFF